MLDVLRDLSDTRLACVAREHGRLLVSHGNAKGVACETRSEPPPSLASLAVGSTQKAKRMCLLADVRNAISLCSRFAAPRILYYYVIGNSQKLMTQSSLRCKTEFRLTNVYSSEQKWMVTQFRALLINYIISHQQRLLCSQKICKLAICDGA